MRGRAGERRGEGKGKGERRREKERDIERRREKEREREREITGSHDHHAWGVIRLFITMQTIIIIDAQL